MLYGGSVALWRAKWLETKVGLRADLVGAPGICSLVWPVIWRVRFVEAVLMYLDSLRLPSCARTPHVGSSIIVVKATKEKCFLMTLHELFVKLYHHCFKEITKAHIHVDSLSVCAHVFPRLTQDKQRRSKPLK
ncbi:hypothetical protein M9H77_11672 [Catharanthus roseus]|uniref:Uncharacterized protein n=1 Tax=Catharanthus roseus TaxID=4058 RepID=A0ACC0BFC0_CATRO|nr:hypothetical protein M9H77_11672 [Catharanthus roseus]